MARLLAFTALILCLLPAAARAQDPAAISYTDEPAPAEWQALMTPAAEAWGGQQPVCPQGVTMSVMDDPGPYAARAVLGGCRIWVNRPQLTATVSWLNRCKAIVHEWGHLLGHEHEPDGIMRATSDMYATPVPVCERQYPDPGVTIPLPPPSDTQPPALPRPPAASLSCAQAKRVALKTLGHRYQIRSCRNAGAGRKRLLARARHARRITRSVLVTRSGPVVSVASRACPSADRAGRRKRRALCWPHDPGRARRADAARKPAPTRRRAPRLAARAAASHPG